MFGDRIVSKRRHVIVTARTKQALVPRSLSAQHADGTLDGHTARDVHRSRPSRFGAWARAAALATLVFAAFALSACASTVRDAELAPGPEEVLAGQPGAAPGDEAPTDAEAGSGAPMDQLTWAPPSLVDPITITIVAGDGQSVYDLQSGRDYVIAMPDAPVERGLAFVGGRHVVMIGGEIAIGHQGANPTINARRALFFRDQTGTIHVEGVLMRGGDLSEGIQTSAPRAVLQVQNVGIFNVHARDQVRFSDNHPDIIQTWGNIDELRVDGLSGSTDYQGLFFKVDHNGPNHGPITLRRISLSALPTARFLLWFTPERQRGHVELHDVWVRPAPDRTLATTVWPDVDRQGAHRLVVDAGVASWPRSPTLRGEVREGTPPDGDFIRAEHIGVGYVSPGYASP
jgi:hypothetical protein